MVCTIFSYRGRVHSRIRRSLPVRCINHRPGFTPAPNMAQMRMLVFCSGEAVKFIPRCCSFWYKPEGCKFSSKKHMCYTKRVLPVSSTTSLFERISATGLKKFLACGPGELLLVRWKIPRRWLDESVVGLRRKQLQLAQYAHMPILPPPRDQTATLPSAECCTLTHLHNLALYL